MDFVSEVTERAFLASPVRDRAWVRSEWPRLPRAPKGSRHER